VQYVQMVRLEAARDLLESGTGASIGQVATQVGYDDPRVFARNFRARFGKLPSEWGDN
jgi:transcriptional regulator GlxA family with amidase domain